MVIELLHHSVFFVGLHFAVQDPDTVVFELSLAEALSLGGDTFEVKSIFFIGVRFIDAGTNDIGLTTIG